MGAGHRRRAVPTGALGRSTRVGLAVLTLCAVAPAPAFAQDAESAGRLEATLFRTFDRGGVTVVDGLANVPLAMLAASTESRYRFEVAVEDEAGNVLHQDSWERPVSARAAELAERGGALAESFRFGLRPGRYLVSLRAYPTDAPGLAVSAERPVEAPAAEPVASDLLLARAIARVEEGEGVDAAAAPEWPITHGGMGISASAVTVVTTDAPDLYYYIELYVPEGERWEGRVWAEIRRPDGSVVYRTPEREVEVVDPGGPFPGQLSLAGLPAGDYELVMHVDGVGLSETRTAPFRMAEAVAAAAVAGGGESGYFWELSDGELARLFDGVGILLTDTQRQTYAAFPPDARRRFLTEFFGARDPDPKTTANEFLDEYLQRVGVVFARYNEVAGTGERQPWLTPRGRIYLRQGEPTDRIEERFPGAGGDITRLGSPQPPYEIWYYGKTTGYVYLFADETGLGNYRLLYSTDPSIQSLPDWPERAGEAAILDLQTNFGIKPRFQTGTGN